MTLKANSKATLDIIATQKKQNATAAYKEVHPNASDITARNNAYQLMKKPEAKIYLQKHIDRAKKRIVELVEEQNRPEIALKASQDILDREYGKATPIIQGHVTNILVQPILSGASVTPNPPNDIDTNKHVVEAELA